MKPLLLLLALTLLLIKVAAGEPTRSDIEYARVGDYGLALDLYLPAVAPAAKRPLLVWVHGGGWGSGSKSDMPLGGLVARGFAVASVDYRLSKEAPFPAQIHDLKAAIRFLRAHAASLGCDAERVVITGGSAGGHLAALVGVTNGVKELEGEVGADRGQSSEVQGIVSFFGASNLQTILSQSTPHGLSVRVPALQNLLRCQPEENPTLARLASPVAHVDAHDPPLLLIHGDADPQMPFAQSLELQRAYDSVRRPVQLEVIAGGKHGGREFYDDTRLALVVRFLDGL